MKWAVGVTTCPTRKVDYLDDTLVSIQAAGWAVDAVNVDAIPVGPWPSFLRLLARLLSNTPDAVLICQDDVILAAGLRAWIEAELAAETWWPGAGVVSPYVCAAAARGLPCGWNVVQPDRAARSGSGACSVVLSAESARLLLASPPHPEFFNLTDLWLRKFCRDAGRPWVEHVPSLCRHVGRVTAITVVPGEYGPRQDFGWNDARHEGEFLKEVFGPKTFPGTMAS